MPLHDGLRQFESWAERFMLEESQRNLVRSVHYHLTDKNGLEGILRNQEVWFTEFQHLNDTAELIQGVTLVIGALRAIDMDRGDGRLKLLFDCVEHLLTNDNIGKYLTAFIASFSRSIIDVGVWRSYADDARGFAIGFAPRFFNDPRPDAHLPGRNAFSGKVYYPRGKRPKRLVEPLERAAVAYQNTVEHYPGEMAENQSAEQSLRRHFANQLIAEPLIWNCLTTKHPGFRSERELRLVLLGMPSELAPMVRFRSRFGVDVPYIPYPFDRQVEISRIVVGPAAPEGSGEFVRELLRELDMNVRVIRSDIPYRSFADRSSRRS